MGQIQTTTYECDQCRTRATLEYAAGGGVVPVGWVQVNPPGNMSMGLPNALLIFDTWGCVEQYAKDRQIPAEEP